MLVLRILALPIALLTFAVLYGVSIKAPHLVELVSLILWVVFPFLVTIATAKRIACNHRLNSRTRRKLKK